MLQINVYLTIKNYSCILYDIVWTEVYTVLAVLTFSHKKGSRWCTLYISVHQQLISPGKLVYINEKIADELKIYIPM